MLGIGFAVKSLPAQLPPIVYALFSGLNSAAVGLVRSRRPILFLPA